MGFQTNENKISADLVMRLRRATDLPVMVCKDYLQTVDPDLVHRVILAYEEGLVGGRYLCDPIEFDPLYSHALTEAEAQTQREVIAQIEERRQRLRAEGMEHLEFMLRYTAHLHWSIKKIILKEQFNIEWRTPAEMNPGIHFA